MAAFANQVKLFGRWSFDDVSSGDISVEDFIAVKPKDQVYVPHTGGRYQVKRFRKAQCPIVERLVNSLMRKGVNNGKKFLGVRIVQQGEYIYVSLYILSHLRNITHLWLNNNDIMTLF
jgi:small subunit ribosomal protein S5e